MKRKLSGRTANRVKFCWRRTRLISLVSAMAFAFLTVFGAQGAMADTGGSGGAGGGTGGGSANPDRKIYLDVYDKVGLSYDPITHLPQSGQGWGSSSIDFFINRAVDAIAPSVPSGPNDVWSGFNNTPAGFPGNQSLPDFIRTQCQAAIDEAVDRNPEASTARVVALQFSYDIWHSQWQDKHVYSIVPATVYSNEYKDTLGPVGTGAPNVVTAWWPAELSSLVADSDLDGTFSHSEYEGFESPSPTTQVRTELESALDEALAALEAAVPGANSGKFVSCVAMNNLEPEALIITPQIDVSKNAEDVDGVSESVDLTAAGVQDVTAVFTNTGDEALESLTFADNTTSGNAVIWESVTLPNGTVVPVAGSGTPADVTTALDGLELAVGAKVTVTGKVNVTVGENHADTVTVTGTGVISGQEADDADGTGYVPPAPSPQIDVSKNAEDVDGVSESVDLTAAGVQDVTAVFTNTGDEALESLTFADNTTSGNAVIWESVTLPNGTVVPVAGSGTPADVTTALDGLELAVGAKVTVTGKVNVTVGENHADTVTVTGTGVISGQEVDDADGTGYTIRSSEEVAPPVVEPPGVQPPTYNKPGLTLPNTGAEVTPVVLLAGLGATLLGICAIWISRRRLKSTGS